MDGTADPANTVSAQVTPDLRHWGPLSTRMLHAFVLPLLLSMPTLSAETWECQLVVHLISRSSHYGYNENCSSTLEEFDDPKDA